MTVPLFFVYLSWVFAVMEPEWFLTKKIGGQFYRIPTLILPILMWIAASSRKKEALYWPFVIFVLLHMGASVLALNSGFARVPFKFLFHMYFLYAATVSVINTPAKAALLLKIYIVGFIWYGAQGMPAGLVRWHPLLANEDSYGPLMGIALGFSYYFALATEARGWKFVSYALCALALAGVVAANARGAVLSAGLAIVVVWLRSPSKLKTLAGGLVACVVILSATQFLFPGGEFWAELSTITEGAEEGTGQKRVEMWKMAVPVFWESPIVGVGVGNFGVVAADIIPPDVLRAQLQDPNQLYGAQLHSVYVRVFCEEGIVGIICWIWMLAVFAKQILMLRSKQVVRVWRRSSGTALDIGNVSRALELGMVAFLANAFFYNQMYIHWFWTLIALSATLSAVASRLPKTLVEFEPEVPRREQFSSRRKAAVAVSPDSLSDGLLRR